jgi:transcriptional regulator of acetoin/glycerol metabolism
VARISETVDQSIFHKTPPSSGPPTPGLLLVFSAGEPLQGALPLEDGAIQIGRGMLGGVRLSDSRMSREHAEVRFAGGRWAVRDLQSRNGTAVDGVLLERPAEGDALRVVRTGDTVFLLCADLGPYRARVEAGGAQVVGPRLRAVWEQLGPAGAGGTLHVTGESGSGKELAAREFHRASGRGEGPFVPVNCAAIPEGMAERLFFGARKGAYSGAGADAAGYLQEADGGTLFLDEVGELDLVVQAKLLRALETREVLPLGAARPVKVDLQICSATHRDLRARVADKRFREDLYYRIARPHLAIPPLRERREEIAFLIDRELRAVDGALVAHVSLVEACLLRPWPGNVRELLVEVRAAAAAARAAQETTVKLQLLAPTAGLTITGSESGADGPAPAAAPTPSEEGGGPPSREAIEQALRQAQGRVATAARTLGLHRTQLRRWLAKHDVDPRAFDAAGSADDEPEGDEPPE